VVGFAKGLFVGGIERDAIGVDEGIFVCCFVEGSDVVRESVGIIVGTREGDNVVGFFERLLVGVIEIGGFVGCVMDG
jgi:hypothetical protein